MERALRALDKHKPFEELKRAKERARRRRAARTDAPRERWRLEGEPEDDASADFEPIRRSAPAEPRPAERADEAPEGELAGLERAEVVSVARTRVRLRCERGEDAAGAEPLAAAAPPGLDLAVGDRVALERRAGGIVLVRARLPRASWLARPDPSRPGARLVLAANVGLVLCVVAAREPRWRPGFVDRVLLAAEEGRARAAIVVNKLDLLAPEERGELGRALDPYRAIGARVLAVSALTGEGVDALRAAVAGQTCVVVGPSGAGKSSLLNALDPALGPARERATGAVRASDGKGRHTTTASELVALAGGARVIDTPGIRELGLAGIEPRELAALFPELAALAPRCRFRDCAHLAEPACAVRAALEEGALERRRYEAYARIRVSLEP